MSTLRVATFTNIHGHKCNGVVLAQDGPMVKVLWDDFPELERLILERKSSLNAADERSTQMHVSTVDTSRGNTVVAPLGKQKFYNRRLQAATKGSTVETLADAVIDEMLAKMSE